MKNIHLICVISLMAFMASATPIVPISPVSAATITVTNSDDSGAGSLRQAIIDAISRDTIKFDRSLAESTITLTSGELIITKDLTIFGLGAESLTISGNNTSRVIFIPRSATVRFLNLTISDGSALGALGGGIINDGKVTFIKSNISGNVRHRLSPCLPLLCCL